MVQHGKGDRAVRRKKIVLLFLTLLICIGVLSACSPADKTTALKVIIVPKFEIDGMESDFPGEAQLFYEKYCSGC